MTAAIVKRKQMRALNCNKLIMPLKNTPALSYTFVRFQGKRLYIGVKISIQFSIRHKRLGKQAGRAC